MAAKKTLNELTLVGVSPEEGKTLETGSIPSTKEIPRGRQSDAPRKRGRRELPEDCVLQKIEAIRRQLNCAPATAVVKYVEQLSITGTNIKGEIDVRMADGRNISKSSAVSHLKNKYSKYKVKIKDRADAAERGQNIAQRLFRKHFSQQRLVRRTENRRAKTLDLANAQVRPILAEEVEAFREEFFRLARLKRQTKLQQSKNRRGSSPNPFR